MLSGDQIRLGYRLFLRREPNDDEVRLRQETTGSLHQLMDALVTKL
jgi:hypothetical protein